MMQLLDNWLKNNHLLNHSALVNALFKQKCLLCDSKINSLGANTPRRPHSNSLHEFDSPSIHAVCNACLNDLPWHTNNACPQCGLTTSGQLCGSCINSPPSFDATHSVFLYDFPINAMMVRYKYGNILNLGDTFSQFLAEKIALESLTKNIDLVIPMPMHPQRLKERGFNQALEIAKILTKNSKQKLNYKCVERQTLTPPQASLPLKERVKNIKGAFKVEDSVKDKLTGKRIAIVDDVMTTGASLNELAKTLKKAGASHVECWVIARTLPHK